MTDPEVKDDNAVRVYVPTDVRPEMLDGPEAQALRNELDATRAQLAAAQARLTEAEGLLASRVMPCPEFHTRDAAEDWVGPCTAIYTIVCYARRPTRAK